MLPKTYVPANAPSLKCYHEFKGEKHMAEGYGEAGRRLYAAMISYRLGLKSVDYTLKNYVAAEVHPSWAELAEALDRAMSESVDKAKIPRAVTDKIQ